MYRQGDVLVVPVEGLPESVEPVPRDQGRAVLAHGEATGHAHAISDDRAALFRAPHLAAVFLQVSGEAPVALEHEEHAAIALPPGTYRIVRQREYQPGMVPRHVAD
jgi:hypothetical protein